MTSGFQQDNIRGSPSVTGFGLARTRFRTSSNVADGNSALSRHLGWANVLAAECRTRAELIPGNIQLSEHVTKLAELPQHYSHSVPETTLHSKCDRAS